MNYAKKTVSNQVLNIHKINFHMFSKQLTSEKCKSLLIQAICSILMKCKDDKYRIVILPQEDIVPSTNVSSAQSSEVPAGDSAAEETVANV